MPRGCQVVSVFTRDGRGGNYLGVVNDVSALTGTAMQEIATELGFAETVFADWRDDSRPPRLRIFTPATELDFAGHPLVGTAWVYDHLGPGGPGEIECNAAVVSYSCTPEVTWVSGRVPVHVEDLGPGTVEFEEAGFPAPDRAHAAHLPARYLIGEYTADVIGDLQPVPDAEAAGPAIYIFNRSADRVHARFFARELGGFEDAATGSAAVALAHVLSHEGEPDGALTIHQGIEMGHPSEILLRWGDQEVSIGGSVDHVETRYLER